MARYDKKQGWNKTHLFIQKSLDKINKDIPKKNKSIIITDFGSHHFSNANFIIANSLRENGFDVKIRPLSECKPATPDYWLVSILTVQQYLDIPKFFKKINKNPIREKRDDKTIFIAGGYPLGSNPEPIADFFDLIGIGEYDDIGDMIEDDTQFYRPSEYDVNYEEDGSVKDTNQPKIKKRFVSEFTSDPQLMYGKFFQTEISRGCKNKCPYCQLGWGRPYREVDKTKFFNIARKIRNFKSNKFNPWSSDLFGVSYIKEFMEFSEKYNIKTDFGSVCLNRIKEIDKIRGSVNLRIGVEGISERLRMILKGKKITNDELIEDIRFGIEEKNIGTIKLFFMYNYPTEDKDDIYNHKEFLMGLRSIKKRFVLSLKYTPIQPLPQTPFQFNKFVETFDNLIMIKEIDGEIKGMEKNYSKVQRFSFPDTRAFFTALERGGRYWSDILLKKPNKDNWKELITHIINPQKLLDYRKYENIEPWDFIDVGFSKRQLYEIYKKRNGIKGV